MPASATGREPCYHYVDADPRQPAVQGNTSRVCRWDVHIVSMYVGPRLQVSKLDCLKAVKEFADLGIVPVAAELRSMS